MKTLQTWNIDQIMQILAKSISKIKMEKYNQHKNIILDHRKNGL